MLPAGPGGEPVAYPYLVFRAEMDRAGIAVEEYRGQAFHRGPAVTTDEPGWPILQGVIMATTVRLYWETVGLDFVIYPTRTLRHGGHGPKSNEVTYTADG